MAVDKLVDSTQLDADLTSIANAIRTKGGTSASLAFPAGFVSAVQAIPTGITPTGTKSITITANGTTTEDVSAYANAQITANVPNTYAASDEGKVVSNGALVAQGSDTVTANDTYDTTLINSLTVNVQGGATTPDGAYDAYNSYAASKVCPTIAHLTGTGIMTLLFGVRTSGNYNTTLQEVYAPNVTAVAAYGWNGGAITGGCFYNCSALKTAYFPLLAGSPGQDFFRGCTNLENLTMPNVTDLSYASIFFDCKKLTTLVFSKIAVTNIGNSVFRGCTALTAVDLTSNTLRFNGTSIFQGDSSLSTLILRVPAIVGLSNINTFQGTPLASGGSGGTIYIPKVLYDHLGDGTALDYKAATNWSTIDGYGTITWAKIEGSVYETKYADGTTIT